MSFSSAEISLQKTRLRQKMKAARASLTPGERLRASEKVCEKLGDWLQTRAETRIAIYLATPLELNLDALAAELIRRDKIVCAPRMDAATSTICFARLSDLSAVSRGAYGVRAPLLEEIVCPEIALVPGLAFDENGGRLGMGGGYYDRALMEIPVKVGIGFRWQFVDEVPIEVHDIKMNWLASEAGLVKCDS